MERFFGQQGDRTKHYFCIVFLLSDSSTYVTLVLKTSQYNLCKRKLDVRTA